MPYIQFLNLCPYLTPWKVYLSDSDEGIFLRRSNQRILLYSIKTDCSYLLQIYLIFLVKTWPPDMSNMSVDPRNMQIFHLEFSRLLKRVIYFFTHQKFSLITVWKAIILDLITFSLDWLVVSHYMSVAILFVCIINTYIMAISMVVTCSTRKEIIFKIDITLSKINI